MILISVVMYIIVKVFFFTSKGSEQPPNWLIAQGCKNDHLGTS